MNAPDKSPAEPRLTSLSHGGGCGCKIAPGVLSKILEGTAAMRPKSYGSSTIGMKKSVVATSACSSLSW